MASGNWAPKYVTFQVPVGYNNVSITPYLYGHYGAGTVEYDDYRIEEFDSEPVGPPALNQDSEVKFDSDTRFTDKLGSVETGLVYFGARWYDPEVGRFISRDPIQEGLNWYEFCNNNPLRYVDLTGLYAISEIPVRGTNGDNPSIPGAGGPASNSSNTQTRQEMFNYFIESITSAEPLYEIGPDWGKPVHDLLYGKNNEYLFAYLPLLIYLPMDTNIGMEESAAVMSEPGSIMLGEGMDRVGAAAAEYGSSTFGTTSTNFDEMMAQNEAWLRGQITAGKQVYSVGIQEARAMRSPFYQMELRVCNELGVKITYISGF